MASTLFDDDNKLPLNATDLKYETKYQRFTLSHRTPHSFNEVTMNYVSFTHYYLKTSLSLSDCCPKLKNIIIDDVEKEGLSDLMVRLLSTHKHLNSLKTNNVNILYNNTKLFRNVDKIIINDILNISKFISKVLPQLHDFKHLHIDGLHGENCFDFTNFVETFSSSDHWQTINRNINFINDESYRRKDCDNFAKLDKNVDGEYIKSLRMKEMNDLFFTKPIH